MHARELIEIASLVCLRSKALVETCPALDDDALSEYWIASRCRLDHWGRRLRLLGHSQSTPIGDDQQSDLLARLSEELTLSEVLTRAVAALAIAHDKAHNRDEASPIGRNTLDAHREAQRRLRALRFAWWPDDSPKARLARSLGRQSERWTDVLLAYVGHAAHVEPIAFDASRLREFAYDSQAHGAESSEAAEQLLAFSLRSSFSAARQPPICDKLNRRIAGATLGLFGPAAFDGHGLLRPAWMIRAERTSDDTLGMVDRLFEEDESWGAHRLPERWRI